MIEKTNNISVVGYGSWATAIVGLLTSNGNTVHWHIRNPEILESIKQDGINPKYLSELELDRRLLDARSDINEVIEASQTIIFATPSAYLKAFLEPMTASLEGKFIISATKGLIPDENLTVTEYIHAKYAVPYSHIGIISGPTHAEEVSRGKMTYLSIATVEDSDACVIEEYIKARHLSINHTADIYGLEYAGILKNIYAIAAGMATGLGYGDNALAVLVCKCAEEMERFLNSTKPYERNISDCAYLGDLLVTSYSNYSRNRRLGQLIGKGCTVKSALNEMTMIAEGYFAAKGLHIINDRHHIEMPVADAVYNILYNGAKPRATVKQLLSSF